MAIYAFGPFRLDTKAGILFRGADPVALGQRAIALLRVLVERPGVPVSKDALIEAAWLGLTVEESNLTVQMAALRRVFDQEPGGERWIETLPRRGYRFVGSVVATDRGYATGVSSTAADSDVTAAEPGPATGSMPKTKAERRQLTIMSCELAGSAALSANMELEDLRDVIDAYHRCVVDTAGRFAGFVAKRIGDLALVFFGYPAAHEGDAEQAVRAGLELCAAVKALSPHSDAPLRCRVGIATGMVIVSDPAGVGETREYGLVGEAPNLAARLQGIAEPDMVVVADSTRRLLGNLFEFDDLGQRHLKGNTERVPCWAVLRASFVESRFEALHTDGMTALVGREEEAELLLRRWSRARTGEGQVVLLAGEAGIGKSRLAVALLESLSTEPHARFRYFCSPNHTDSAFFPIIGQMQRAAKLARDDTSRAKLDKLDALFAQTSTSIEEVALFAEMLSLPNDGRYPELDLTPHQRRRRTLGALIAQIEAQARSTPVLMIFEDAHWIDPTSLEVFGWLVDRVASLPVLLIVTFRPEFEPPWIGGAHVTALTINRLRLREVGALIDSVVGNRLLAGSIRQNIVERADGIPLFVEEMTKAVLEAGAEGEARRGAAAIPYLASAVPASLHASLTARLDLLGAAKEVAQIGAAIGREFSHALVAAVEGKPETELEAAFDRLIATGMLFRRGIPPHASYLFKHALVQDAAYGMLLREPRRALHARIAAALEGQFAETAENQPEILARHCSEAGLTEKAAGLWGKAGQRSLARSALAEGAAQLNRALAEIAALPPTPATRREQITLQVALITALFHTKGFAASETKEAVEEARLLIVQADALGEPPDPLLLFSVLYGFWAAHYVAFNGDVLRELAVQFLGLAEKQKAVVPFMVGHRLMGATLAFTGNIAEGRAHYDQAIALYDPAQHRPLALRFGQDVAVTILSFRSQALWFLGYPEAARADAEHALQAARESGHAGTLMYALSIAPLTHFLNGDYGIASTLAEEVVALADERGVLFWKALGTMNRGCILSLTGNPADAIQTITTGITGWRSTAATVWMPLFLPYLARSYAAVGEFEEAWRCIDEAISAVEATSERWCEADIHRTAGEVTLMSPEPNAAKAEAHFERALTVARGQNAKSWELRAAVSLARLWQEQRKRAQARDLLAPLYDWFTEGFETLDLKAAKSLLDDVDGN
jgi:class 3 adenylate cyclase/predicted ATPase